MNISLQDQIGEIVAHDYRTAAIFKSKGIDFCCKGKRTLQDVTCEKGLNPDSLIEELQKIDSGNKEPMANFEKWPLDLIVDYIEKKHHRYIRQQIPVITEYLEHIVTSHGKTQPELGEIKTLFVEGGEDLLRHLEAEETLLFTMIRDLLSVPLSVASLSCVPLNFFMQILAKMESEHVTEGDRWQKIAKLTDDYRLQGCNTMRVTFSLLKEFQDDLHMHIHLENNILFPRAMELKNNKIKALQS